MPGCAPSRAFNTVPKSAMPKATLKALRGSIKKWERIVAGKGKDLGGANCPLCKSFCHDDLDYVDYCKGCPVEERTGQIACYGTPYIEWAALDVNGRADTEEKKQLAQEEVDFLRSLLP